MNLYSKSIFAIFATFLCCFFLSKNSSAVTGTATYYTMESVIKEKNTGITASGEEFIETAFTCALPKGVFGHYYRVTNLENGKSIVCRKNDRGPGKRPLRRGVVIDLSPAAFDALGGKRGVNKKGVPWGMVKVSVKREN